MLYKVPQKLLPDEDLLTVNTLRDTKAAFNGTTSTPDHSYYPTKLLGWRWLKLHFCPEH